MASRRVGDRPGGEEQPVDEGGDGRPRAGVEAGARQPGERSLHDRRRLARAEPAASPPAPSAGHGYLDVELSNVRVLVAKDPAVDLHVPAHPVRFVTAASLFDGHDAAINIMRRILQAQGAEVIHLGHNRCVDEVVTAAVAGGRAGRRDQLLPGRPRRVLRVPGRAAARARRRARPGRSAAAAA